jgi:hypothetical protein
MNPFAARLGQELGTEAWTLVVAAGDERFIVQHALRLSAGALRAEVRALRFTGTGTASSSLAVERAVIDPREMRALWQESSLSTSEVYGATGEWRWRLRAVDHAGALSLPALLEPLADAHLSFPAPSLAVEGEVHLGGSWQALRGEGCLVHRASPEGCRPWAWLALPNLSAAVTGLPGLPLAPVIGWWRWQGREERWPQNLALFRRRFSRTRTRWRLEASLAGGRLELDVVALDEVELERTLFGRIILARVEAQGRYGDHIVGGVGVLEAFNPS